MTIARPIFNLIFLRWLPLGPVLAFLFRLAILGGLVALVASGVKRVLGSDQEKESGTTGWTEPVLDRHDMRYGSESSRPIDIASETVRAVENAIAEAEAFAAAESVVNATNDTLSAAEIGEAQAVVRAVEDAIQAALAETDTSATSSPKWVKGDGLYDCPDDYPIKGKATSMIYHVPGGSHYSRTIPDVCFMTEEEASFAGYRPTEANPHA